MEGAELRNLYDRHFKPAVRRAGLPDETRFHDLRHTCAALLIALGAHPKAILERLGHSSITVTLDRYGHPFPSLDEAPTTGLEDLRRRALADRAQAPRRDDATAARVRHFGVGMSTQPNDDDRRIGHHLELPVEEGLRRAKPLPPRDEMVIEGLTDQEEAAFWAAINE